MNKAPKGAGKEPRGGGAGRAPGKDKMVGTKPDKYGKGPLPGDPRKPPPPPKGKGK